MVPFIDLSRTVREIRGPVLEAWTNCFDRCEFVGGPRVQELEKQLASVLGAKHAVSCANGTDALVIALAAAGVKHGDKVALPNLTFWATYEAVVQLGATPVLIDIDPTDLQMSFSEFSAAHEKHGFRAALLVHLYGWTSARLGDFRAFARDKGIALVEDGAQCFGVEAHGEPLLSRSLFATLSFYPAKVIGGAMDGGAILVSTPEHEKLVRSLCNHGRADHYSYAHSGWNSRMGGVQAAFLLEVMKIQDRIVKERRSAAGKYRELLSSAAKIKVYGPPAGVLENGYLNVLTVEGKKGQEVVDALKAKQVGAARTYPETIDSQKPAQGVAIPHGSLSQSRAFCERVVNLPLFFGITNDEIAESVAAIVDIAR